MRKALYLLMCLYHLHSIGFIDASTTRPIVACRGSTVYFSAVKNASQEVPETFRWNRLSLEYKKNYHWYKDNALVDKLDSDKYERLFRGLLIENADRSDSGEYTIVEKLSTSPKTVQRTNFTLKVIDTMLESLVGRNITVSPYDRVTLKVRASHSGSIKWYFKYQILRVSPSSIHYKFPLTLHYGFPFGSVLEIHKIQPRHAGKYKMTYLVSGCQEHITIMVNVHGKEKKGKRWKWDPVMPYLVKSGQNLYSKMKTKDFIGRILGIIMGVIVVGGLFICCSVSMLNCCRCCRCCSKKKSTSEMMSNMSDTPNITTIESVFQDFKRKWTSKMKSFFNYLTRKKINDGGYSRLPTSEAKGVEDLNNAFATSNFEEINIK